MMELGSCQSGPSSLVTARWALVLLDMLCPSRGDLHTFTMEPLLADVTANPEFISAIVLTTCPTQGLSMFIIILIVQFFILIFWLQWL
uniref:Uncharacterized protein n=1 Tax=Glycine max TaxID=3847 RepID=C6TNW8_SOYBN|nr:unknown [Glycine max]